MKKLERMVEVCAIALFAVLGVKAYELNDLTEVGLFITAATLALVWIVIDTKE